MASLPKILEFLTETQRRDLTIVRPSVGQDLTVLNGTDSVQSPQTTVLAIRRMKLAPGTAIPFHVHAKKEKVYICESRGYIKIIIFIGGEQKEFVLQEPGDRLVIPPNCPHAVIHTSILPNQMMIIASSQNADDIAWEDSVETLLLNQHQKAA